MPSEKGFGFIEQDGGGPDVFAHYSEIKGSGYRELTEGEHVTFDIGQGQKGRRTSFEAERRGVRAVYVTGTDPRCRSSREAASARPVESEVCQRGEVFGSELPRLLLLVLRKIVGWAGVPRSEGGGATPANARC
jgi:CspA family cold shock protein